MRAQYRKDMEIHNATYGKLRLKDRPMPPALPPFPIVNEATTKGLARCLQARGTGVALIVDEISTWFKAAGVRSNRNEQGGTADRFLSLYDGHSWSMEKNDSRYSVHIDHAFVSMFGGIQPARLANFFSDNAIDSGLFSRFTFVRSQREELPDWSCESISEESRNLIRVMTTHMATLNKRLLGTKKKQLVFDVDRDALKEVWVPWYRSLKRYIERTMPEHGGILAKQSIQASRVTLLLHIAEQLVDNPKKRINPVISRETLERALKIADWLNVQKFEVMDLVKGATEGRPVYEVKPTEMKVAQAILANIDYIRASDGVALNSEIQAWVAEAGVEIGASALGRVFTKLGLAHHKKGSSRGIRLDDETYEALSRRFRQYVQTEEELPVQEDFPSWDED